MPSKSGERAGVTRTAPPTKRRVAGARAGGGAFTGKQASPPRRLDGGAIKKGVRGRPGPVASNSTIEGGLRGRPGPVATNKPGAAGAVGGAPKLRGTANAITRGKGKKIGLRRRVASGAPPKRRRKPARGGGSVAAVGSRGK
jgi:hypothetical protein